MALINRIKYNSPSDDAIVWKFPSDQIRFGAQLVVNESQNAVFFMGGKALDTFGPGTHSLSSGNLPLISKLVNLPFSDETPFAAEVWFVNRTVKRDIKWGTKGPIQVVDPHYHFPISVRAFGKYGMRISDARSFVVQIVGTQTSSDLISKDYIGSERIEKYFAGEILQKFTDALAKYFVQRKVSIFHVNSNINELSFFIAEDIRLEFSRFGIDIVNFNVERISIPEEEQKKIQGILGKRMEIEQVSQAQVGQAYTTMRTFDTLEKAAENEGGGAGQLLGAGLGLGAGFGAGVPIGQQVGGAMNVQPQQSNQTDDPIAKLQKLKQMLDSGLISQEDFDQKKKQIIDLM